MSFRDRSSSLTSICCNLGLGLLLGAASCKDYAVGRSARSAAPPTPPVASAPVPTPASAPLAPIELPDGCRVYKYQEGGVTLHSFVGPEVSEAVNSDIIETAHHLVIVDTQMLRPYAKRLRAYADSLGKPISHVIISHAHPDHYFGLEFFSEQPTYALKDTIARMHRRSAGHQAGHKAKEGAQVIDTIVYPAHELTPGPLNVDGVDLECEELQGGEDVTQLLIRIPAAKTLIIGDMGAGAYHAFTGTLMLDEWSAQLDKLKALAQTGGYTHILPGHGTPGGVAILSDTQRYLAKAKEVFATAKTQEEYVKSMRAAFPGLGGNYIIEVSAIIWDRDRQ